MNGIENVDY